jgi:hypothetical protein
VTYWREYENFTHLPGESIDALFQRFTVVVNNMRANIDILPYDDHDSAVKLLHALDHTMWDVKVEVNEQGLSMGELLMVNFHQPSHEFTFNVGIDLLF